MPLSDIAGYHCLSCQWVAEGKTPPPRCARCLARTVQSITKTDLLALLAAHVVHYCDACHSIHLR